MIAAIAMQMSTQDVPPIVLATMAINEVLHHGYVVVMIVISIVFSFSIVLEAGDT